MAKNDSQTWLLEEYKLLSSHYFHEDAIFMKGMSFYSSVNGGLLIFLGSDFLAIETVVRHIIPVLGIVLCASWVSSLVRIREYRTYITDRIKKIEEALHSEWANDNLSILPADIRTLTDWAEMKNNSIFPNYIYRLIRNYPSSYSLLLLPLSFSIAWVIILILQLI